MRYMLDTNICIHVINQKPAKVIQRFKKEKIVNITISSITLSELKFGAYNSSKPLQNLKAILKFTAPLEVLPFGGPARRFVWRVICDLGRISSNF